MDCLRSFDFNLGHWNRANPTEDIRLKLRLNSSQGIVQLTRYGSNLIVAVHREGFPMTDCTNRANHSSSTRTEALIGL